MGFGHISELYIWLSAILKTFAIFQLKGRKHIKSDTHTSQPDSCLLLCTTEGKADMDSYVTPLFHLVFLPGIATHQEDEDGSFFPPLAGLWDRGGRDKSDMVWGPGATISIL